MEENRFFKKTSLLWTALLVATFLLTAASAAGRIWRGNTGDFVHFWQAAGAMLHGQDIYSSGTGYYIYPPLIAFLFQPLALISERNAALTWLAGNAILSALAAILASKEISGRWFANQSDASVTLFVCAACVLLTVDKLRSIFLLGQIDCLMLLGFVLVLCWTERAPIGAGLVAGLAANFKYLTLIFVPYFVLRRNYRAACSTILFFVLFLFLPALETGWRRAVDYAAAALGGIAKLLGWQAATAPEKMPEVTWDRSVSLTSAIFRMTRAFALADFVAIILVFVLLACALAGVILMARRNGITLYGRSSPRAQVSLEWSTLIFFAIAFSPHTTARQLVLVLLIFTVALTVLLKSSAAGQNIPLVLAIILMTTGLSFPPFGIGLNRAYWAWRFIGGPCWCALILILVLCASASYAIAEESKRDG